MPTFVSWRQALVFAVALAVLLVNQFLSGTELSADQLAGLGVIASLLDILFPQVRERLSR